MNDTIPAGSGSRNYELPVGAPQEVILRTSGREITLLLVPGSALVCNLDFNDLSKISFASSDTIVAINNYLAEKDLSVKVPINTRRNTAVHKAKNLQELSLIIKQLYHEEFLFFNNNKHKLPKWYERHEYWNIRYNDACLRLNSIAQRALSKNTKEAIPANYFKFLDSLEVKSPEAKYSNHYYLFLYELFNKRMNDAGIAAGAGFLDYQISQANKELSGEVLDFFKAFIIQITFNHYKQEVATDYIKNNKNIFYNSLWLNELNTYFKSKDNRAAVGKTPPGFALADITDSLISLKSLKGNVIVLSFWFAGCKPCIEEFPAENALAEKFKNQPVRIVSVCVNTSEAVWKQWSERFALKTTNLWANAAWEKTITDKYDLAVFPKYVLIDRDYKIVEMNAERPSKGLEQQITSLLAN
ncbi:TlpA family protein disulfide reductase [Dyadobacter soli]|uniref:TlpA family protein disulfide reductase n=1 Tax=Dyadobacter soli TaxID=659014 RepID=UPI0015A3FB07|nr:redoxin family protein [Dyadobacter soli]